MSSINRKTYVLDTNILLTSPHSIFSFDEHNVSIADITLLELDNNKTKPGETGANAREAIRLLDDLRKQGNLSEGIQLPLGGGIFKIEVNHLNAELPPSWDENLPDHRILRVCKGIQTDGLSPILVSNDIAMRIKADIIGIPAEEYKTEQVVRMDKQYRGRNIAYVSTKGIDDFYKLGKLPIKEIITVGKTPAENEPYGFTAHEFFLLVDAANEKHTALGRFDGKEIVPLLYDNARPYGVTPRNIGQKFAQEALMTPVKDAPLVILKGPAGTAKTFYSLAVGLERVLEKSGEDNFIRILVTRPNQKFDDDIGYLKGSEEDKIGPLMRPIMDNLETLTKLSGKNGKEHEFTRPEATNSYADYLLEKKLLVMQALAYMRGRSIADTWIIVDEAQNMTPMQAFGIISRAGEGSKVILTGDVEQIDNPHLDARTNGLSYACERMKDSSLCWQMTFNKDECRRSALALEALKRMSPKGYQGDTEE